jgi:hypothetical protein|tara:strand:+ start:1431 stop:1913 length:483 start_codon:yes stop_codon:yes gene_type:complete
MLKRIKHYDRDYGDLIGQSQESINSVIGRKIEERFGPYKNLSINLKNKVDSFYKLMKVDDDTLRRGSSNKRVLVGDSAYAVARRHNRIQMANRKMSKQTYVFLINGKQTPNSNFKSSILGRIIDFPRIAKGKRKPSLDEIEMHPDENFPYQARFGKWASL